MGRDTLKRLEAAGDSFALRVRDPSDLRSAISALKLARMDVLGLATRPPTAGQRPVDVAAPAATVSSVVSAPQGPLFLVEHFSARDLVETIPELVQRRLEKAGVESAEIDVPARGGSLDALDATSHAVVLRLFPRRTARSATIPADWLDFACEWVTGDLSDFEPVRVRMLGVEYDVPAAEVSAAVHECGIAKAWCDAVNGDLTDRLRIASATFGRLPHLALGAGGPQVDHAGLVNRYRLLQEVARELAADVAYGCIDFEPTFEGMALGLSPDGWQTQGGASPNVVARELLTDRVPDAYPYQVLGPEHVRRLGEARFTYESLGDGHIELSIDEPATWLPDAVERDDSQAMGWDLLAPCLVREDELDALLAARDSADVVELDQLDESADGLDHSFDLESITLESTAHPRRGTRLTLLELVSWLNHEAHSDLPVSVSPVLATFARWLSAGFDDADRQALKAIAPRLIGTGPASADEDRARQWLVTQWLVRVQAPAWLRAAGMLEAAQRLEALDRLTIDLELVRAVDILGTAITIASRRLDITASIATDEDLVGTVPDEQIVWEAWERVAETTGYVAASEAATHGAPAELTYATDLRVIECSRDPRVRDELDVARQSVGDTVWATALHAVADEAWENAWQAADRAARELSGFTVRVEMGRIASAAWGTSEDEDTLLEAADQAARDSLTRAALTGGAYTDEHPWDAARNAARSSEGGKPWSVLSDEARRTIGEDAWAQAMADARAVVTDALKDASDTVARVVVAAVAREASSAAARGVALRAAAVARAQGGDQDEAKAAANEALQRVAIGLLAEALALLDRLIDVEVPTAIPQ